MKELNKFLLQLELPEADFELVVKAMHGFGAYSLDKLKQYAPEWAPILDQDDEIQFNGQITLNRLGNLCFGMFKKGTDEPHGLLISCTDSKGIFISQWRDNKRHGFSLQFYENGSYALGYYKNDNLYGELIAYTIDGIEASRMRYNEGGNMSDAI